MLSFAETPWDADIDAALCRAGASPDRDRHYIAQTATLIESGLDPDTGGALSLTALKAWEERATTTPPEEPDAHDVHPIQPQGAPRTVAPQDLVLQNPRA